MELWPSVTVFGVGRSLVLHNLGEGRLRTQPRLCFHLFPREMLEDEVAVEQLVEEKEEVQRLTCSCFSAAEKK